MDSDPQQSLRKLWMAHDEVPNPRLVSGADPVEAVKLLKDAGYNHDYLFVDTPPLIMNLRKTAPIADVIVCPVQTSLVDLTAISDLVVELKEMDLLNRVVFVLNRVNPRSSSLEKAHEFLSQFTDRPVLEICDRVAYQQNDGVPAVQANKKAHQEIEALWKQIAEVVHERDRSKSGRTRAA